MPYYRAGDYYRGNYQAGGLFGSLGKLIKKGVGAALSLTPAGAVAKSLVQVGSGLLGGVPRGGRLVLPEPGIKGTLHRLIPGGSTGLYIPPPGATDLDVPFFGGGLGMMKKRRRLDPLNVKALRRAGRRLKGFLRVARRLGALPVAGGKGKRVFKLRRKK